MCGARWMVPFNCSGGFQLIIPEIIDLSFEHCIYTCDVCVCVCV